MDPESSLLQLMSSEELENCISEKIRSFHGLLTREAALTLLAREHGVIKKGSRQKKISEIIKGDRNLSVKARVKKLWPIVTYKSGKKSRAVELEDEGGSIPLVLWNDDINTTSLLRSGDEVLLEGIYEKGGELHFGYAGRVEVTNSASFVSLDHLEDGRSLHFRGLVSKIHSYSDFSGRPVFSFLLSDLHHEARCIIWASPERGEQLELGDEVILESASVRNGDIYLGADSRMLLRRPKDMLLGVLTEMENNDSGLKITVGDKKMFLDRSAALEFIGVEAADDILLSTIVMLKKKHMLNTFIARKWPQK